MADNIRVEFVSQASVILAFPALFVPQAFKAKPNSGQKDGPPRFSANFLFRLDPTHTDIARFNAAMREAARLKWGNDQQAPHEVRGTMMPIEYPYELGTAIADRAKANQKDREDFRPYLAVKAGTDAERPPSLGVTINGVSVDVPAIGPERAAYEKYFFGGADVMFKVNLVPRYNFNNPAVTAYLNIVHSLGSGTPIKAFAGKGSGVQQSASSVFGGHVSGVSGQVVAGDPLAR